MLTSTYTLVAIDGKCIKYREISRLLGARIFFELHRKKGLTFKHSFILNVHSSIPFYLIHMTIKCIATFNNTYQTVARHHVAYLHSYILHLVIVLVSDIYKRVCFATIRLMINGHKRVFYNTKPIFLVTATSV